MRTPEGALLKSVLEFCKKIRVSVIRMVFRQGSAAGWPDLCVLIPGGKPLFMELKAPNKKPTKLQDFRIKTLLEQGYDVVVCDDSYSACAIISSRVDAVRRSGGGS